MYAEYTLAISGILFIVTTIVVQGLVATIAHRKQQDYIPGIVDDQLGHGSFVFRSHRTYQNSLENALQMLVPAVVALLIAVNPVSLAVVIWIYAIARVIHMALYYAISTEKNPSPRSYFYMIGFFSNIYLLAMVALQLFA